MPGHRDALPDLVIGRTDGFDPAAAVGRRSMVLLGVETGNEAAAAEVVAGRAQTMYDAGVRALVTLAAPDAIGVAEDAMAYEARIAAFEEQRRSALDRGLSLLEGALDDVEEGRETDQATMMAISVNLGLGIAPILRRSAWSTQGEAVQILEERLPSAKIHLVTVDPSRESVPDAMYRSHVAYGGTVAGLLPAPHLRHGHPTFERLSDWNHMPARVAFAGGRSAPDVVAWQAKHVGLADRAFTIDLREHPEAFFGGDADFVVHLPQMTRDLGPSKGLPNLGP